MGHFLGHILGPFYHIWYPWTLCPSKIYHMLGLSITLHLSIINILQLCRVWREVSVLSSDHHPPPTPYHPTQFSSPASHKVNFSHRHQHHCCHNHHNNHPPRGILSTFRLLAKVKKWYFINPNFFLQKYVWIMFLQMFAFLLFPLRVKIT